MVFARAMVSSGQMLTDFGSSSIMHFILCGQKCMKMPFGSSAMTCHGANAAFGWKNRQSAWRSMKGTNHSISWGVCFQ